MFTPEQIENAIYGLLMASGIISSIIVLQKAIPARLTGPALITAATLIAGTAGMQIGLNPKGSIPLSASLILFSFVAHIVLIRMWWKGAFKEPVEAVVPTVAQAVVEPTPTPEAPLPPQLLPDDKRTEHMMIVAGSGSGKTQLLQSLLLKDLDEDATIIVMDSQSSLINNLLNVVPVDRLVHITPTDKGHPLALNLFEKGQDSTLYEYIFQAFGGELTPQMATVFRYVARLVAVIPNGNINTMRIILEKNGLTLYQSYVPSLPPIVRAFFENQYDTDRSVVESRQAVLRRLYAALENETFAAMFSAPETKLDIAKAMNDQKVILIDTAKGTLTGDTFKIFGRFFLAQTAKAMFDRTSPYPHRVYLYIDEFQEYAGEEGFVTELFTQARKWNVGIIVAFQYLAQMPDKVLRAILSNTALKFVGKVSAADRKAMASELGISPDFMHTEKGTFITSFRNSQHYEQYWKVPFGELERQGRRSRDELEDIRYRMREAYSWKPQAPQAEPSSDPDDVAEAGKW